MSDNECDDFDDFEELDDLIADFTDIVDDKGEVDTQKAAESENNDFIQHLKETEDKVSEKDACDQSNLWSLTLMIIILAIIFVLIGVYLVKRSRQMSMHPSSGQHDL